MSNEYLNRVFAVALTGAKKSVLVALADRANNSGHCYPSLDDIAFRSGCSKRNVILVISELEMLGFLSIVRVQGGSNKYTLLAEKLSTTRATMSRDKVINRGDTMAVTGDTMAQKGCHHVTLTINNPQEPLRARAEIARVGEKAVSVPKPDKKIINREMKHIRELLIHAGGAR